VCSSRATRELPPGKVMGIFKNGARRNVGAKRRLPCQHGLGADITVIAKSAKTLSRVAINLQEREMRDHRPAKNRSPLRRSCHRGLLTPARCRPSSARAQCCARCRPGSALVDVDIDQGGIAETSRPTQPSEPAYREEGVGHYCGRTCPAAVAQPPSLALEKAVFLPFIFY